MLCTFWLRNVLRTKTACTFSTSQLLKVLWSWSVLYILTWKCASRHNGVQLFISHLASWLRTRRFSEPTFRPSGATNHWKNSVSRLSYLSGSSLFWDFLFLLLFSSLTLPISAFHLSILSEVWLLNFLRTVSSLCILQIYEAGILNSKTFKAKPVCTHHSSSLISIYPYGKSRQQTPTQEPFAQPAPVCCCPFSTHVHVIFWVCNCLGRSCSYNYKCDIYIYIYILHHSNDM